VGDKELRVRANELHRLSVECENCKSEVLFEVTAPRGPGDVVCPNCSRGMLGVANIVMSYRTFFAEVIKVHASFLVRIDD
jgi:hypothetical protein